ncbi:hypothetical protein BCT90_21695 [Vibrio lentus]|uniref:Uncharacterized protein n=1 Tax=Vibrio lentus TaxID=136468 RepID=A0A2N7BUG3_9VIBR|nr:hypothetical protein BCV34_11770 [Vibrio lentus]PME63542.1 hypothetical protein BCV30_08230 [Vibrio lentus]PME86538.1 hypothetical protein BCV27_01110 [Vibrio lentus]PMH93938.1 hypothetical protein BCU56_21140 [Vibrio lentus]PMI08621.1 hypothetical protein BCU53_08635 [Vibrio lentus]
MGVAIAPRIEVFFEGYRSDGDSWLAVKKLMKIRKVTKMERITTDYYSDKERYSMFSLILLQILNGFGMKLCG